MPGDLEVGLSVLKAILGVLDARLRCLIDRRTDRQMDRDREAHALRFSAREFCLSYMRLI